MLVLSICVNQDSGTTAFVAFFGHINVTEAQRLQKTNKVFQYDPFGMPVHPGKRVVSTMLVKMPVSNTGILFQFHACRRYVSVKQ